MTFRDRLKHAWNAFRTRDSTQYQDYGRSSGRRPDRVWLSLGTERTILASILARIMIDVASVPIKHVRLDQNGRYAETINSNLNDVLSVSANIDQTARAFMHDCVLSLIDEGSIAIVPVDTTLDPNISGSYDIQSLRVGQILEFYPSHIKVRLYNEQTGMKEDIILPKKTVAIVENPLYAIMNEPNSTLKRLILKLNILDAIDNQSGSGKLNLLVTLPYTINNPRKQEMAANRKTEIEEQLNDSKYGIGYIDASEKVIQLNRPVDNNLMDQIKYLTGELYNQLGLTKEVMEGTADEATMLNYYNRTIEPILSSIVDEMHRKFLTKTARSQKQAIIFIREVFKLVPVNQMAEIADKFTRNAILSPNEIRAIVGFMPSKDPKSDKLENRNMPQEEISNTPQEVPAEDNIQPIEKPDNVLALEEYAKKYI